MGKSLILDNFPQNSTKDHFFIKIILNTCKEAFKNNFDEKLKNANFNALDFILKDLLQKKDSLEINVLKYLVSKEKLVLMFDGLDEVTEYKSQLIALIDILRNDPSNKLKKILITTRNHLKADLEDYFKTVSFDLNNFNDQDQKLFLYKYWRNQNLKHQERASSSRLKQSAEDLITKLKSILSESINQLMIPVSSV